MWIKLSEYIIDTDKIEVVKILDKKNYCLDPCIDILADVFLDSGNIVRIRDNDLITLLDEIGIYEDEVRSNVQQESNRA